MLDKQLLVDKVRELNDSTYSDFKGFPISCKLASEKWSECFYLYSKNMIPISSSSDQARKDCELILVRICDSDSIIESAKIFEDAIIKFALTLCTGISPASSEVLNGIPPSGQISVMDLFTKSLNPSISCLEPNI